MPSLRQAWTWLVDDWQWPQGVLFVAAFLVAMLPAIAVWFPLGLTLIYAQLPVYLVHQWEEHAGDRFRAYVNGRLAGGFQLLTRPTTFWINFLGVWVLIVAALYAAMAITPAAGLIAGYLTLLNGLLHLGQTARFREYNPGLLTAAVLMIPLGGWCVFVLGGDAHAGHHAFGIGTNLVLYALIIGHCMRRWRKHAAS